MSLLFNWSIFYLSLWALSPAAAITGGKRVPYPPGSIGRIESNGNYLAAATYVQAKLDSKVVGIALSTTTRFFNATEQLRFIGKVTNRIDNTGGIIRNCAKIIYYTDFQGPVRPNVNNTYACVLDSPITEFQYVCVLSNLLLEVDDEALVAGWGATVQGGPGSQLLDMNVAKTRIGHPKECDFVSIFQKFPGRTDLAEYGCTVNDRSGSCANDRGVPVFTVEWWAPCLIWGVTASGGDCGCEEDNRWSVYIPAAAIWRWLNSLGYWGTDLTNLNIPQK